MFSNSVIEHLQTSARQAAMAAEVRRLASTYWIQTPNFWFPVEPHFLAPAWHWLPVSARVALLRRRRWGWRGPCPDPADAEAAVREIRLMRGPELRRLFPEAKLVPSSSGRSSSRSWPSGRRHRARLSGLLGCARAGRRDVAAGV